MPKITPTLECVMNEEEIMEIVRDRNPIILPGEEDLLIVVSTIHPSLACRDRLVSG